jgi:two-component system cell cycle sensor histidine kinase/response regulator CckA
MKDGPRRRQGSFLSYPAAIDPAHHQRNPARPFGVIEPHDHLCLVYDSDEEWREAVVPFLVQGLKQDEKCIYIVDWNTVERIRDILYEEGLDATQLERLGQLSLRDQSETYTDGGSFDPDRMIALLVSEVKKALSQGYRALRVTAEMTWFLRDHPGSSRLAEYEARVNKDVFHAYPCLALCQYDRRRFPPELIREVILSHPFLLVGRSLYRNFYYIEPEDLLGPNRAEKEIELWLQNLQREHSVWEALCQSEHEKSTILSTISELVAYQDAHHRIIWANRAAGRSVGLAPEALVGRLCYEIWHNRTQPCEICPVARARQSGAAEEDEVGSPDGRYWHIRAYPVLGPRGAVSGVIEVTRDITDRVRAQMSLKESEERYRALVEHAGDAILVAQDGLIQFINPRATETLGRSAEELSGRPFIDFIHPDDRALVSSCHFKRLAGEPVPEVYPFRVIDKEGNTRWVEINAAPIAWNGRPATLNFLRDITARTEAEQELTNALSLLSATLDATADGILVVDRQGKITSFNRTFLEMWRIPEEIIRSRDDDQALAFVLEQLQEPDLFLSKVRELYARPEAESHDVLHFKDGRVFERFSRPQRQGSAVVGRVWSFRDVTERYRAQQALATSEQRYRLLAENATDVIWTMDLDLRFTYLSPSVQRLRGYSVEEALSQGLEEILTPASYRAAMEALWDELETESESASPSREPRSRTLELEQRCKDGSTVWTESTITFLRDADGKPTGILGVTRDVSRRKEVEGHLRATREQLFHAQKMEAIGRLAGGIAHDFNNLLTVVDGYAQLSLAGLEEGSRLRKHLELISEASNKASGLTKQLLAFSRRQVMEMQVLDLNAVLRRLEAMLRPLLGKDIELAIVAAEGIGRVRADPTQVQQVILNLAANAKDAMPGGGTLTIETANVELDEHYVKSHAETRPGPYVMLSVSDTGTGMTPEIRQRIFEPFFTTKELGRGTGLGLATVYGILRQSNAHIWVYSEPGQGTTFKIYFPRVEEPLTEPRKAGSEGIPKGDETILLVEDDRAVRQLAARLLNSLGYRVVQAADAEAAVSLCERVAHPIHLLLVDVVLPGTKGPELAAQLERLHPEMKVLYMSGYTDNAIVVHGVLEPGVRLLQKPFSLADLAKKVRETLDA